MRTTVNQGQNLFDIGIQTSGTAQAAFDLALANDRSLTDGLVTGEVLQATAILDRRMQRHYADYGIVPATASDVVLEPGMEGIGYWYVEYDFRVS
jgi:hypothetical protein